VAVQPPSMLRGKSIEEIVNKWAADLDTHVREFNTFAAEVAVWDRALVENGNTVRYLIRGVQNHISDRCFSWLLFTVM
jgi:nuclear pore complex protein Nup62